jgi:uncharacterized membrane protein YfcA
VDLPFDLTPLTAAYMAVVLFGAAFVRGYSGFGLSALVIAASGLVTDPLQFVPVVLMADVVLTLAQARGIWPHVDWQRVVTMFVGALVGVPAGLAALSAIGTDGTRLAISLFILVMCGVLWWGWSFRRRVGPGGHVAAGVVSGFANAAGVGGLPVAAFFTAQNISAAGFRATLIVYFTAMDFWTLPLMGRQGLITQDSFVAVGLGMPLLLLGIHLGGRHFLAAAPQEFRRFAIVLLAVLAVLGLIRAVV